MLKLLTKIIEIQDRDIKMIRLMRLKRERQKELDNIQSIKNDCHHQLMIKESEIMDLKRAIRHGELDVEEAAAKVKRLEEQQNAVKKVDEFNSLSREIAGSERDKTSKELKLSDLIDNLSEEEEVLGSLKETLESTTENSKAIEDEIKESIGQINAEGRGLKSERDKLTVGADPEVLPIYERLLKNKKDRVIVPIEDRTCSGCHIVLTAQHENMVRKGERLVFCEHCSRIHYWPEPRLEVSDAKEESEGPKRRRRRSSATT
jgi:predicted  nucleic acid-binding Zn-ribbon protein